MYKYPKGDLKSWKFCELKTAWWTLKKFWESKVILHDNEDARTIVEEIVSLG